MNVNVSEKELLNLIKEKINQKKPFLISRFGEGEMRMFNGGDEANWIINRSLGYILDNKSMDEINKNMELTLINSDITGLPTYNGKTSEEEILNSEIHSLYKQTYSTFRNIFNSHKKNETSLKYCDVNIHSNFEKKKLFKSLLTNIDELVIITCRDIETLIKNHFKIKNITHYKIPPEFRYEDNPSNISWNFYPKIHNEIKKTILNQDNSGKLLLYGAGVAGKDLGLYFKQSGGVAFDIGSVFDTWAGKKTRGQDKGKNVYFKSPLL